MAQTPLSEEIAAALSKFFVQGAGPSHRELDEVFRKHGVLSEDPAQGTTDINIGKEVRVRAVLGAAAAGATAPIGLVNDLLARMRVSGCFHGESGASPEVLSAARRAFQSVGWFMDDEGHLSPAVLTNILGSELRPALEAQIRRIRKATEDPALMIGTAKELLETTSRYILEGAGSPARRDASFAELLHLARGTLGLLPEQVPDGNVASKIVRETYDGLWKVAKGVNDLRNEEGTGHGRTALPTTTERAAGVMVQAAALLAELMLTTA